ncbi:hypothetical protein pipiens_003745 [Culex pipiens pipiens]|uniref:Mitochondrial brown fat uncoupling protein 1 n=1 Tax=Culex pipiens pipiens TaxID=38569 RepID=A0ABD1CTC3_CULPP
MMDSSEMRVRKYNRTVATLNGTLAILQNIGNAYDISLSTARSALGNNQFNEYPMKIPRKSAWDFFHEYWRQYQNYMEHICHAIKKKTKKQNVTNMSFPPSIPVQLLTAGTAACIADMVTFPLDTAKVRLQIQGEQEKGFRKYRGLTGTIVTIARQEGFQALYGGLSAGLQRQMCFSSIRLGLYESVKTFYASLLEDNPGSLQIGTRICAGLTTGGLAVLLAHPTHVVKVRGQADSSRFSTGTLNAYRAIYCEEGIRGLWKGAVPNMGRISIVNVAEVVVYDVVKDTLLRYVAVPSEDVRLHFGSAVIAGFAATLVASPVDVVKTRYINSPKNRYRGVIDCAIRMRQQEGFLAFYKGFVPSFSRLVSWNVVMWITYEQLKIIVF